MALPEREGMDFDVVIVGAGPAGLAAAIRLKQIAADLTVVVVEKGSEVGAHILSGAVIDPLGLDRLLPDWRQDEARPLKTEVERDEFLFLTKNSGIALPNFAFPKFMSNHGNFVGSLSNMTKYLGAKAEELGVEIYPGFPASEVLYDSMPAYRRRRRDRRPWYRKIRRSARRLYARHGASRPSTPIFGEGARGSLTKTLIDRFKLNAGIATIRSTASVSRNSGNWQARPTFQAGPRAATPWAGRLPNKAGGGSWLYHFDDRPALGRLRDAPELREPDPVAIRGVPALQDPSDDPRRPSRARNASATAPARLWRAVGNRFRSSSSREVASSADSAGFVNVPAYQGIA